ncbi:MAG: hypothetical protein ABIU97_08985 [Dehalococcoidia bacterium]
MARALIGPTGYGTFGIVWRDYNVMERRGGYSGPYSTIEEAEQGARSWTDTYDEPLTIEHVENVNDLTTSPDELCAVTDCERRGRPHICLYDGRYHRHGHIHYETAEGSTRLNPMGLTFRHDGWRFICNSHYQQLKEVCEALPA